MHTRLPSGRAQRTALACAALVVTAAHTFAQEAVNAPPPTGPGAPSQARVNASPAPGVDANGNAVAPQTNEATTDRVFVTGSAIPTAQEVGPNPVLTATREAIEKSGDRTAEQFLRNLPVANANSIPLSNNNNGSDTAIGAAGVALRGFDARATLVLIDGRRVAPYPITNSGIAFVDLFSIPRDAIETVEILKDGASTTYGADAVAGVVNLKLRKDYRGAEVNVEYGNTTEEDSSQFAASVVFGAGNDRTNVTGVLNYYHRNSIANRDRDYSAVPPFLSSNASPYNLQLTNAAVAEAGGTVIPTASGLQFAGAPSGTNGLAPASQYLYSTSRVRAAGGLLPGFNFNEFSLSFPDSERYGGYLSASHKIYGDQLVAYADGYFQNVKTHNELAPPATGNFQTTGATTVAIPPREPNPAGTTPFGGPTYEATGVQPGAFNPFNPFNQIISGGTRARLAEFGNRLFDNETDSILTTVGLRGDKLFDGTWGYDTAFRYSEVKNLSTGQQVSISRFNRILNQADPIFDPNSPEYIGTTVAFNPFGDFRVPIASNQASVDFARVFPKDFDISKIATVDGSIYTTDLFSLPAGGIGFAAGAQFRRESLREDPDELNFSGDIAGNSPLPAARGGRKSYAFYAETSIPIFSQENAIPGFHSLEFTAAGRYEEFRNNDSNVVVPKFGMRWQPLDETLTLRATWGKGFRQPSLEELYGSGANSIEGTLDPITGIAEPETTTISNSNPGLQPEDSESISAGLVYSPKFVPGLTLSVDFFDIERTGVVIIPEAQQVLEREAAGNLLPGEQVIRNPDGSINVVIRADQNAGFEKARGADFGLQYTRETPFGTLTWITQATFLDEFLRQQTPLDPVEHLTRGPATDASDEGYYQWRGDSRVEWAWKGFSLIGAVRYYDGFHELDNAGLEHWVSQTWIFDLQASYTFLLPERVESAPVAGYSKAANASTKEPVLRESGRSLWETLLHDTRITIGCNNVFDKDPPTAYGFGNNSVGYPGFTYDATGQFVYVRLSKKF